MIVTCGILCIYWLKGGNLLFILFEFLNRYTGTYAQFKMIDLRLVFIVFMGSLYGINYGISAAALETCSLIAE